jgi:hypothetical protein
MRLDALQQTVAFRRIPNPNAVFPFLWFKMSLEAFQQLNACKRIQADTDV